VLDAVGFRSAAPQLAVEALQLLTAPNCPSEVMDVLLAPDQIFCRSTSLWGILWNWIVSWAMSATTPAPVLSA